MANDHVHETFANFVLLVKVIGYLQEEGQKDLIRQGQRLDGWTQGIPNKNKLHLLFICLVSTVRRKMCLLYRPVISNRPQLREVYDKYFTILLNICWHGTVMA